MWMHIPETTHKKRNKSDGGMNEELVCLIARGAFEGNIHIYGVSTLPPSMGILKRSPMSECSGWYCTEPAVVGERESEKGVKKGIHRY
jgi:hypothetical protein